jgi:hypothetical protein
MRASKCLKTVLGGDYAAFIKKLFAVDMSKFSRDFFNHDSSPFSTTANDTFIEFMKQSYNDLCICWSDPQNYNQCGERTLFSEIFLQQLKIFAKMAKVLFFKWIEKKKCKASTTFGLQRRTM